MDFLGAVNRVLVNNFILKGDDDLITTFNDNQHEATIRVARNAITTELNNFLSFFPVDYERRTGSIVTVASERVYEMPSDFVRFFGDNPYFYCTDAETKRLYEYKGGEKRLRQKDHNYLDNEGHENWWYWQPSTTKSVALYQIPDTSGRNYSFEYEMDNSISNSTDVIPLHTESEAQAFADMASRRFKYMTQELDVSDLDNDADYIFQRSTLMNLMRYRDPDKKYGKRYS